ncbi:alkaline phosphatase family protein [Psychrosphaera haliotis]|uniref:Alkaline phosphatase family protein n=1 Tax=Psychrosphaera haliotis TaxID=555083 RepID=A0A6N8FB06_9GAMM|nr:alkaline phosphatase family protein [Psychrosphaera haliotis]MUH73686.1 hypothetical protein [Psychrosphaera haliotis]
MTDQSKNVILVEFNELVPHLVDKFMAEGHLPNFKRLADKSRCFVTDAAQSGEDLNPWIQWVTVHTGLTPEEHTVYRLNEADKCKGKYIWDDLSAQGKSSLIFGSMNGYITDSFKGTYLPDPWDTLTQPSEKLKNYAEFIKAYVQGNPANSKVSAVQFLSFMVQNGLSFKTCLKIAKQLIIEKFDAKKKWRRAGLLDWIQLDVFRHLYKKERPTLATIFSNSTAHIQHTLWKESFPEEFGGNTAKTMSDNPMLISYINHDKLLGDILKLADENTEIALCTALSQQPYTKNEKCFYHINDFNKLVSTLSIPGNPKYIPVMAEQFHIKFDSKEAVNVAFEHLSQFEMLNDSYFYEGSNKVFSMSIDENTIHIKNRCSTEVKQGAIFRSSITEESFSFYDLFYKMDDQKTGIHHPHGIFWITSSNKDTVNTIIPLEEVNNKLMAKVN